MMKIIQILFLASLISPIANAQKPIELNDRREIFVDHFLIDHLDGVEIVMHSPIDEGIVFSFSINPGKGHFSAYVTILKDAEMFRAYYRGVREADKDGNDAEGNLLCGVKRRHSLDQTQPGVI